MRRTAIPAILTAALLVAGIACRPSRADKAATGPTATVATEPAPTTTTDPYAIPSVIDAAYVNRVLAGLDAVAGDALRTLYQTRNISADVMARANAIYAPVAALQIFIDGLQLALQGGFNNYKQPIGNRLSVVSQLVTTQTDCIFAQVHRDYSAIGIDTSGVVNPQWIGLKRLDTNRDPRHYNPTSWSYVYDGFTSDRAQPQNPCAR